MELNNLAMHILLSLLKGKATGYELTKAMSKSHVWRSSHQQIYRELVNLEKLGLVTFIIAKQEGKPDRKPYSITPAGLAAIEVTTENTTPVIPSLHSIRTVMVEMGNKKYFKSLSAKLTKAITLIKADLIKTECLIERLAMNREIAIHTAELDYCADVIKHLSKKAHSKAA